ncbi:MAG: hypothetical protein J7J98_09890 [candidate division Zixibacteria bacterium]|nr:hypothetical protein [candidate division Zixibacteria bacterium]
MRKSIKLLVVFLALPLIANAEVAETYKTEAGQSTGIASNVAIDVIGHGVSPTGVWLATGKGVAYSPDDGTSWFSYNTAHGLPSENLSAIFSVDGRIWVASNHNELINEQLMTLSDGLSYSDDDGETWVTLDFGPDGLNIPYVEGGDRTIFDITGHTDPGFFNNRPVDSSDADWLFFAAFAGGLLASQDGGDHWQRIFPSPYDSIQFALSGEAPSLRNRYFSCVADTSHGDSLFLWAGTAAGIFQYVFAPPRDKLYSHWINRISFCDSLSRGDGSLLFIGGESGLSLGSAAGGHLATRFEIDGLPGEEITATLSIGDRLLVGTADHATGMPTGLAISYDGGESFTTPAVPWALDSGLTIIDFAKMNGRVYAAIEGAGLYVSVDSGQVWQQLPLDTLYTNSALWTANSLATLADTLLIGTDSGLVNLTLDGAGDIIAATNIPFVDTDSTGAKVIRIRHQTWSDDYTDHSILWTINRPLTGNGIPMVGRFGPVTVDSLYDSVFDTVQIDTLIIDTLVDLTYDTTGFAWNYYRQGVEIRDVNFFSDTVFMVGDLAVWFSPRGAEPTNHFSVRQYYDDTLVVASLDNDTVTVMEVRQDTVIFGSSNGVAISTDRGRSFEIYRANTDTLSADVVVNHSYISSGFGLVGDFIPALGVQYLDDGLARIWAGARPATFGNQGISAGDFDPVTGNLVWQTVYKDDFAWNFEFIGDTIFAATNNGLLLCDGALDSLNTTWGVVALTDSASGEVLVEHGTGVYGVEMIDPYIWVGTDDGTVRLSRSDLWSQTLFRRVDSTTAANEVYAFPVPFRPNRGQEVDFHFVAEQAGTVTLEIYDFAMNLVARPLDNVELPAGIYPPQGSQGVTWDGYNAQGDMVAVGIYYFKVEFQNGDTRWGKLAVIP